MDEVKQPALVELIPNLWVRPEQVAAIWEYDTNRLRILFVGSDEPQYFVLEEMAPLREIVERLFPIRWEQPDRPPDDIVVRDYTGRVVYRQPTTGNEMMDDMEQR